MAEKKKKTDPNEILPADPKDVKVYRKFWDKLSSKKEKDAFLENLVKQLGEYERGEQAKKMATDEFRQSMKKPGAVNKYAKQQSENEREKKRKEMDRLQKQLEKEYKGMQREAKRLTGKSIKSGPTIRDIMGKEYRQGVAKGGSVKKYSRGGGVRTARF